MLFSPWREIHFKSTNPDSYVPWLVHGNQEVSEILDPADKPREVDRKNVRLVNFAPATIYGFSEKDAEFLNR